MYRHEQMLWLHCARTVTRACWLILTHCCWFSWSEWRNSACTNCLFLSLISHIRTLIILMLCFCYCSICSHRYTYFAFYSLLCSCRRTASIIMKCWWYWFYQWSFYITALYLAQIDTVLILTNCCSSSYRNTADNNALPHILSLAHVDRVLVCRQRAYINALLLWMVAETA